MSSEPVPSTLIFVEAGDALLMYASPDDAGQCPHLRAFEEKASLVAYGSDGALYRVQHSAGRLSIEKTDAPAQPSALKEVLLGYFEACEDPADADEPLDELVARAWTIECDYRRRCGSDDEIARRKMPWWGHILLIGVPLLALYWGLRHR
jgi:hypothetical protein